LDRRFRELLLEEGVCIDFKILFQVSVVWVWDTHKTIGLSEEQLGQRVLWQYCVIVHHWLTVVRRFQYETLTVGRHFPPDSRFRRLWQGNQRHRTNSVGLYHPTQRTHIQLNHHHWSHGVVDIDVSPVLVANS
jgi:hypothetical protein